MAKKRFSIVDEIHQSILKTVAVTKKGEARIKRVDVRKAMENAFAKAAKAAASGERVRFPIIGALARREVKARKGGKGVNPFTGQPMMVKSRPASKKPRWSFPKNLKDLFGNKRNW